MFCVIFLEVYFFSSSESFYPKELDKFVERKVSFGKCFLDRHRRWQVNCLSGLYRSCWNSSSQTIFWQILIKFQPINRVGEEYTTDVIISLSCLVKFFCFSFNYLLNPKDTLTFFIIILWEYKTYYVVTMLRKRTQAFNYL